MSRTLRRLIPSPAMIVALVALVMSLGGSAYATLMNGDSSPPIPGGLIQNNSVTSKEIQNNSVTGKDVRTRSLRGRDLHKNSVGSGAVNEPALDTVPSASGLEFWAVVENTGVVDRPKALPDGGVPPRAEKVPMRPGVYRVIFNSDVHKCSYQATIGGTGDNLPGLENSQITVSADSDHNAVSVQTAHTNTAGVFVGADMAFQLAVIC